MPSFQRIVVPRGWTGDQDIEACIDIFGVVDDYFGEALARVDAGYDRLERSVDQLLLMTASSACFAAHITHRIDILQKHFSAHPSKQCAGFLGHLSNCRFALGEYFRIMPGYVTRGDYNWLFPLLRLKEVLIASANGLCGQIEAHSRLTAR